jgi:hypothetical protein
MVMLLSALITPDLLSITRTQEKTQEGLINDTQNNTQDTTKTQEKTQGGLIYAKNQLFSLTS